MAKYKTLVFEDSFKGRSEMGKEIDRLSNMGWELESKETILKFLPILHGQYF